MNAALDLAGTVGRQLVEHLLARSPELFIVLDAQGRVQLVNRTLCALLEWEQEELTGSDWFTCCIPAEERDAVRAVFARIVNGDGELPAVHENTIVTRHGARRTVRWHNNYLRAATGAVAGCISVGEDLTAERTTATAHADAQRALRALLDAIPESAFLMRPDGTLLAANATAAQRLNLTPAALAGRNMLEVIPAEVAAARRARLAEAVRERRQVRFTDRRFGRTLDNIINPVVTADGTVESVAVFALDITERQELIDSLRQFRALARSANFGTALLDVDGRFTWVNACFAFMLGHAPDALLGEDLTRVCCDQQQALGLLRSASEGGFEPREVRLCHYDGQQVPLLLSAVTVKLENRATFIGLTAVDLSTRLAMERELQASGQRHRALAEDLARANELLRAADRQKDHILSVVSHELRSPVTIIRGMADLLRMGNNGEPLSERQQEYAQAIISGSDRLSALINNLLDLAKLEACSAATLALAPVDLLALATEQGAAAVILGGARRVTCRVDGQPLTVTGDRTLLAQALLNLLSNAVKFSPPQGEVVLTVTADGERALLTVTDRGPGVPPDARERIFDKFAQAARPQSGEKGTGLGLAIVREIVLLHDGSITVDDAPGGGAVFVLALPRGGPAGQ